MASNSFQMKQRVNELGMCSIKGCPYHRCGVSKLCSRHLNKRARYGDPLGVKIQPKIYEDAKVKVNLLLSANPDHPGIKRGIGFFDTWLSDACTKDGVMAQREFLRLYDEGVTGKELFIECASIWIFSFTNPWTLETDKPLTFALGIGVLCFSKRFRSGSKSTSGLGFVLRRTVGEHIRRNLSTMFMNFLKAVKQSQMEADELKAQFNQPLNTKL